jgi:Asp-tRNA(Asn)/Glu-tRNA(Gln) amidotransferase A subunit family amidase
MSVANRQQTATSGSYDPASQKLLTFHDAVPAFRDGSDSPRAYLERCLEAIEAREPEVQAWVTINRDGARKAADEASARYKAGKQLSPIDGMPVGIKDLFMTKDMPTEMGSPLFKGNETHADSALVYGLRMSGAVILGKTVTTELGFSHPGPTRNPFDPDRTPGGSSSGSAAAIGAGMVPATIGSQVVGSVIRPASFCGNYAIKPTLGALNRGERAGTLSQSHIGVHAGSLEDMWAVAYQIAATAGGDAGYPGLYGEEAPAGPKKPTHLILLQTEGWEMLDGTTRAAFEKILDQLRRQDIQILTRADSPTIDACEVAMAESLKLARDICCWELRWSLRNLAEKDRSLMSESLQQRLALAEDMSLADYRAALDQRERMRTRFKALAPFADGCITLSSVGIAPPFDGTGSTGEPGITHQTGLPAFNAATSALGAPAITLPLMGISGMPVGVQIVGQLHRDQDLTGLAAWMRENVKPVTM